MIRMANDPNESAEISDLNDSISEIRRLKREGWAAKAAEVADEVQKRLSSIPCWEFHFASIGAQAVELLESKHPATAKQQNDHRADNGADSRLTTNPDTFPQALLAAAMTGVLPPGETDMRPPLTLDEVKVLFASDAWTGNDKVRMFWKAREADATSTMVLLEDAGNG